MRSTFEINLYQFETTFIKGKNAWPHIVAQ